MKLIALQSIKVGGRYVRPYSPDAQDKKASEFEVSDRDEAKALIASGAARERSKFDDGEEVEVVAAAPNTAPRLPASGEASPPDTADVAAQAKGRQGR